MSLAGILCVSGRPLGLGGRLHTLKFCCEWMSQLSASPWKSFMLGWPGSRSDWLRTMDFRVWGRRCQLAIKRLSDQSNRRFDRSDLMGLQLIDCPIGRPLVWSIEQRWFTPAVEPKFWGFHSFKPFTNLFVSNQHHSSHKHIKPQKHFYDPPSIIKHGHWSSKWETHSSMANNL